MWHTLGRLVGPVRVGGEYCLDVIAGGGLEAWAGELEGGRHVAVLWNRSPAREAVRIAWADFGAPPDAAFAVRDVWAAADRGVFKAGYEAVAEPGEALLLVLTPA